MGKTALIVDDSNSARVVLKRMLETHDLDVDTAESAEDALVYLNDHRPDVIFMDHMMPGMDGFEAVSAIKNNPDTATIPIMMYTSQQGELYVGQARALGAVGVLPKQVEPVEVSKVLESLRVIGAGADSDQSDDPDASESGTYQPNLETLDQDLRVLIQDLFDQQRAVLRRDLLDSSEAIAARVADEIKAPEPDEAEVTDTSAGREIPARLQIGIAALVLVVLVFTWLYVAREQSWLELQQTNIDLQRALEQQQEIVSRDSLFNGRQLDDYRQSADVAFKATLNALEWAANQSSRYAIDEFPFGDRRLAILEELADRLRRISFAGVVRVESHVGIFCMRDAGTDDIQLVDPTLPAEQCNQAGFALSTAFELGSRQSVAFANFVSMANDLSDGRIRYEIISVGGSDPLLEYPATRTGINAGAWNDIAADNHRVEISLFPDL